ARTPARPGSHCKKARQEETAETAKAAEKNISLRSPRFLPIVFSCEASHAAIAPLRGDQADQHQEQRRHVPQLALFDHGHAAAEERELWDMPALFLIDRKSTR